MFYQASDNLIAIHVQTHQQDHTKLITRHAIIYWERRSLCFTQ